MGFRQEGVESRLVVALILKAMSIQMEILLDVHLAILPALLSRQIVRAYL